MFNSHCLEKDTHQTFLAEGRTNPITGEKIEAGHTIVFCASCKSAFLEENWEYIGGVHCEQSETLLEIPQAKNYFLQARPQALN